MKKIPLLFSLFFPVFLFLFNISYSQSSDLFLLELNNGISIKCYLKEYTAEKELIVISEDGKEIKVKLDDVKKFERISEVNFKKEDSPFKDNSKINYLKRNTFTNTLKVGPMRNGKNDKFYFSASDIVNYELGEISIGAGISYDAIPDNAFIPVFADLKYNIATNSPNTPFVFVNGGYSFTTDIGSGYMFALGVGLKTKLQNSLNFIADFGYKYQRVQFTLDYLGYSYKIVGNTNYLTLNAGIQF